MSEPITRRKILIDYRIRASRCVDCGRTYFPPKFFCNNEGRKSRMNFVDYFYSKGTLISGSVIRKPTNKFHHLSSFMSTIVTFDDGNTRIPGRITDFVPSKEELDITLFMGKNVVPRFRRLYADGDQGLIYYSSFNFSFEDDYYPYQKYVKIKHANVSERAGIVGYGIYLPKFRIKGRDESGVRIKERTVPFLDEDATTFAVEAGKRALIHSCIDNRYVRKCFVGSESSPYAVKPTMSTVSQALQLGEEYDGGFFSGGIDSQFACKAATDLFIDAVALVTFPTFGGEYVMVIGSDNSQAERNDPLDFTVGAGAAAFLFGKRDVIATLDHYVPYTSDTPDFYRRDGQKYPKHGGRFTGEPAYFKHVSIAMETALKASRLTPKDIRFVVCHSPNVKYPYLVAQEAGFEKDQIEPGLVVRYIGNLYSGSSPTALAAVLDIADPGDRILMTSYGSGAGSESYIFTVTKEIENIREKTIPVKQQIESPYKEYVDYGVYRKWKDIGK
ncbi:MAG: hydroxymethylglutaryl-CoA synthase [Candidatus Methylarchaceae archaeon HK02M2]|nr:hydroxymethylglutaryl-CoA synthase [Candidatus Methylarchaceae archaeon HK02M2]